MIEPQDLLKKINSESFKEQIEEAIECGKYTDYEYNGEDEIEIEVFSTEFAVRQVIEVINKMVKDIS